MQASVRIILNTSIQYIRSAISVIIALFTTRIILNALGAEDYGIYNVVGGIIAMLSFLQSSLTQTTQRYLAFYIGKNDTEKQKKVFDNSIITQILIALVIIILLLLIKTYLFAHVIVIPSNRLNAAKMVYNIVLCSLFVTMISAPYMASLIAHENIIYYSIVNIIDSILLIPIAFLIKNSTIDRLLEYGVLLFVVKVINLTLYAIFCYIKYRDTINFKKISLDKTTFFEMLGFTGWNTYSAAVPLVRNQGFAIIINNFIDNIANAAYGIGMQVFSQISVIPASILNAVMPQIVKAEGVFDRQRMIRLSEIASKFCFYLVGMIILPLMFDIDSILDIWLGDVPKYTSLFCIMFLVALWVDQSTIGLASANQAVGRIKEYTLVVSTIKLFVIPVSFILFKFDAPIVLAIMPFPILELIAAISRIVVAKRTFNLNILGFVSRVSIKTLLPTFITLIFIYSLASFVQIKYRFLISIPLSVLVMSCCIWGFGLERDEKTILLNLLVRLHLIKRN